MTPPDLAPPWTRDYFGDLYLRLYRDHMLAREQTDAEVELVAGTFRAGDGPLLDAACGFGRHATELAGRGFEVVGVDESGAYLADAQKHGGQAKGAPLWCRGLQERLPFASGAFGGAYSLFNSWGYLGAREAWEAAEAGRLDRPVPHADDPNGRVLEELARVLRRGARLLLDLPNREPLARLVRRMPRIQQTTADYNVVEQFAYSDAVCVLANETEFQLGSEYQATRYFLRLYAPAEVRRHLAHAGFRIEQELGSFDGEPYGRTSERMIFVARRA